MTCARLILMLAPVLAVGPASAEPMKWPKEQGGNGHYYEWVKEKVNWDEARDRAARRRHGELRGRLVVIVSAEHNAFLHKMLPQAGRGWIGLSDTAAEGQYLSLIHI